MDIEKIILSRLEGIKDLDSDFYKLWLSKKHFQIHIDKRKEIGHIRDKRDYILKTLECLSFSDEFIFVHHDNSWDNICYNKQNSWAVVFSEDGVMMTSYKVELELKSFEELHFKIGGEIEKGVPDEEFKEAFKKLRDRYRKLER